MGMMDAYDYDYDKVGDIVEELHERVGTPPRVNLTALADRGKVRLAWIVVSHNMSTAATKEISWIRYCEPNHLIMAIC